MNLAIDWKRAADLVFVESVQRRAAVVAQLVALALLAAALANITWRIVPAPETAAPSARTTANPASDQKWNLAQYHVFGIKPAGAPVGSVDSLPETNLNLLLRGVIATSPDGKGGGAIIGVPNGDEDYYGIDARLPGGAVLSEVYPDRVVLDRGGRLETLRLPRDVLESSAPDSSVASSGEQPPSLRQYRDMLVSNPQQFSDMVKVAPHNEGGRFIGYEIQSGKDQALFDRLGLAPGDVVTSVNGIALDSPAKALGVLRTLTGNDDVRVDILRNGVPESLVISVQD